MSTKIIDVTGDTPIETKGEVPARSVVIPVSYTKNSLLENLTFLVP